MQLPTHLNSRTLLWIPLLSGVAISVMWACGPWFPDWLLTQGDLEILRPPTTHYQNEVDRLTNEFPSAYVTVVPENTKQEQMVDKAIEDLRAALMERSLPTQEIKDILHQHQASREAIEVYRKNFQRYEAFQSSPWFQEEVKQPSFTPPIVSKGLPMEFSLYFQGAIKYHQNQYQASRQAWESVLNLPEQNRLYRSTWAAFMLGRLDVDSNHEQAIKRFQQVRKLVDEGYKDSLGLGAASLGWEARAWLHQKQYRKAIELYLEQMASGDPHSARISIRWVVAQALSDSPDGLQDLASTAAIRRITTAYLASINTLRWDWNEKDDIELVRAWVDAVGKADAQEDSLYEPLALAVYQRGFYDLSERLLARAPKDGILSAWLKSKLLFRNGNIEEATTLLAKVSSGFPIHDASNEGLNPDHASSKQSFPDTDLIYRTELKESSYRPKGEWGILLLHRGEYTQSLDTLLRAGFWMDAAYIAERVLSTDELKNYVDQNWPTKKDRQEEENFNPEYPPSAWNRYASDEARHFQIRYLLARRLARENRTEEAFPYYPEYWRKRFTQRVRHMQIGYDETQPKNVRAEALWQAAKITRYTGLELIGTELGPDWAIHEGNYEIGVTIEERQNQDNAILKPSPSEIKRATLTRLHPYERWHYRLIAANIAWDALQLMPDNDVTTARHFCEAGGWLKGRDPKAADRFYKALVKRCPETDIGKAADNTRWFPPLDENGNILKKEKQLDEELPEQGNFHSL